MKSKLAEVVEALGKLPDESVKKLYGDTANVAAMRSVGKADDKREAMIDAIAEGYLGDGNPLDITNWIDMKFPTVKK